MAEEKDKTQLDETKLDDANGGRNWFYPEYTYEDTKYIHLTDSGKIVLETTIHGAFCGGGESTCYMCQKCGQTFGWELDEETIHANFATCF
jgi:hypothetical protein